MIVFAGIYYWDTWGLRAAFALIAAFPVGMWIFSRERSPTRAAVLVLLGSSMWLPEQANFDFPILPALDKYSIGALCALAGAYWKAGARLRSVRFGTRPLDLILLFIAMGGLATYYTNQDALVYGVWPTRRLPGLKLYDGASIALTDFMILGLPFTLGRIFLRTSKDVRIFFTALASAGLVYSIPILWEIRMSPTLHQHLWGFAARLDWAQNIRYGGYRPTVFMGHGLIVGFFVCLTLIATLSLRKAGRRHLNGIPINVVAGYLFVILVLCKAGTALIFGVFAGVILLLASVRTQMRVTMFLCLVVFAYPALRVFDVLPTEKLVKWSREIGGKERGDSLQFRFDNEDVLVMKGLERPWFGWGGFGREHVYDPQDAKDLSVQDGHWIIVYGNRGAVGFALFYGLWLLPVFMTEWKMRRIRSQSDRVLLAGFSFITALCAASTLVNMLLPILPFFLSGGLVALLEDLPKETARLEAQARAEADALEASRRERAA